MKDRQLETIRNFSCFFYFLPFPTTVSIPTTPPPPRTPPYSLTPFMLAALSYRSSQQLISTSLCSTHIAVANQRLHWPPVSRSYSTLQRKVPILQVQTLVYLSTPLVLLTWVLRNLSTNTYPLTPPSSSSSSVYKVVSHLVFPLHHLCVT